VSGGDPEELHRARGSDGDELLRLGVQGFDLFVEGLVLALLIVYEGITRLVNPPNVAAAAVLVVALVGIVVNVAATYTLSKANRQSMNIKAASNTSSPTSPRSSSPPSPAPSFSPPGFAARTASRRWSSPRTCSTPPTASSKPVGECSWRPPRYSSSPTPSAKRWPAKPASARFTTCTCGRSPRAFPSLSAHVLVDNECNCHEVARTLKQLLHESFDIDHTTLQVDHESVQRAVALDRELRALPRGDKFARGS